MEPPSSLLWGSSVLTILHISVIIGRSLLESSERKKVHILQKNKESIDYRIASTFSVELESMERMLMQIELTVIAGDHESYSISTRDTSG